MKVEQALIRVLSRFASSAYLMIYDVARSKVVNVMKEMSMITCILYIKGRKI